MHNSSTIVNHRVAQHRNDPYARLDVNAVPSPRPLRDCTVVRLFRLPTCPARKTNVNGFTTMVYGQQIKRVEPRPVERKLILLVSHPSNYRMQNSKAPNKNN